MKKVFLWIGMAIAMIGISMTSYQQGKKDVNKIVVARIIDGDTLELNSKQQIRLDNMETAEVNMCGYEEAKEMLEKLALGKEVRVVGKYVDEYGRLLGLVYTDDYLVNLEMVKSGWARYDSNKTNARDDMKQAGVEAREKKLGVYGLCRVDAEDKECLIKGNNREGHDTKIYKFPGCKSYNTTKVDLDLGDRWFCSEEEAIEAGYTKGEDCFGKDYN